MELDMIEIYKNIVNKLDNAGDIPALIFRLVLAYGFYGTAMMKLGNINCFIVPWIGYQGNCTALDGRYGSGNHNGSFGQRI